MAQPTSRDEIIDYALRKLGSPVVEINVDRQQCEDRLDEALELFTQRHFDGVEKMYMKYQLSQADIDRGSAKNKTEVGIVTTTATSVDTGAGTFSSSWYETSNFIQVPDAVIGINKVFKFDTSSISGGMFSIK